MKGRDRELGMGRTITRRDFLHGAVGAAVTGSALTTGCSPPDRPAPRGPVGLRGTPRPSSAHPPSRLGLRGSHPGSFEVAHELAFARRTDWGPAHEPDPDVYDLVVVGAGVSGLAAAHFYLDENPGARVLLIENHDDFGGHAKRNEFRYDDRTILGYGGSQSLEAPGSYSDVATRLLRDIGVETTRLSDAYDADFYRRHDLGFAVYFDAASWGVDRVVRSDLIDARVFLPVAPAGTTLRESIQAMPISQAARREIERIVGQGDDRLPEHSIFSEPEALARMTYLEFATKHLKVSEPEVLALLQDLPSNYMGHGIDVTPALDALLFGLPGLGWTSLGTFEVPLRAAIPHVVEPYTFHFPDGNASVARLLVRRLIPGVAPSDEVASMEGVVAADFDYGALDLADSPVRLRLDSTVVRAEHEGDPRSADVVAVTYVRAGRTERVRARRVVLACYNMAIPYLCPELPAKQKKALSSLVKIPFVYTNVLLRSWRSVEKLGIAAAHCPGSWHKFAMLDFPVSLGEYRFGSGPDEPAVMHLSSPMVVPGLPPREQSRAGRRRLLGTSFETIEREVRTHLAGMLGAGGFDPVRDIEAVAVNRWPHGYAFTPSRVFDPDTAPGDAPHELGRARFGRIAIANSDAGARAYLDEAIDQAWRAVGELSA